MSLKAFNGVSWGKIDGRDVESIIAEAWDTLAELLEAEALTERAHLHLLDREAELGQTPIGRYLVARLLRRALADPATVGLNISLPAPRDRASCGRCDDHHVVEEATGMAPCPTCQPKARQLWATGHYAPGHGRCAECAPAARQRAHSGDHGAEVAEAQADEKRRQIAEDLR